MWEQWRQGDTLREVARQLEPHPSSVFKKLSRAGGIQPVARSRSSWAFSFAEREAVPKNSRVATIHAYSQLYLIDYIAIKNRLFSFHTASAESRPSCI